MKTSTLQSAIFAFICMVGSSLAGFGHASAADADAPSSKIDPCQLITRADAQAALGIAVGQPEVSDDGLFRNCVYNSGDNQVSLQLQARDLVRNVFERAMKLAPPHSPPVDPSLGTDAYVEPSSGTLLIWKNGVTLNILAIDRSGKRSKASLAYVQESVAKQVLTRL